MTDTIISVTTLPAETVTTTFTSILPASTVTVTVSGSTVTSIIPASTVTITETITLPPLTVTLTQPGTPGPTVTVTQTTREPVATCAVPPNSIPPLPLLDPKSDKTFGCKPGRVCNPVKPDGCNLWITPPADEYLCEPDSCIKSPPYQKVEWPANKTFYYPPTEGYFNLNPNAFGLSFDIFEPPVVVTKTKKHGQLKTFTKGNYGSQTSLSRYPPPSPAPSSPAETSTTKKGYHDNWKREEAQLHWLAKRDESICPPSCYDICNNAYLEAAQVGKSAALCGDGSAFRSYHNACLDCIGAQVVDLKRTTKEYLDPTFQQFISYCDARGSEPVVSSSSRGGGGGAQPIESSSSTPPPAPPPSSQDPPNSSTEPLPIPSDSSSPAPPPPPPTTSSSPEPSATRTAEPSSSPSSGPEPSGSESSSSSGPAPTQTSTTTTSRSTTTTTSRSTTESSSETSSAPSSTGSVVPGGAAGVAPSSLLTVLASLVAALLFV